MIIGGDTWDFSAVKRGVERCGERVIWACTELGRTIQEEPLKVLRVCGMTYAVLVCAGLLIAAVTITMTVSPLLGFMCLGAPLIVFVTQK